MATDDRVVEGVPPPTWKYGVPQNKAMLAYGVRYKAAVFGPHGKNVDCISHRATRKPGGTDKEAVFVGARGAQFNVKKFTFRIERTRGNDGLGLFVGVADSGTDFLNQNEWGRAWAMGCHGCNLFTWKDGLAAASKFERGALPGSEESLRDGSTVVVRVDLHKRPHELAFSINGGDFIVAKGIELPPTVRPFCKLAGFPGDSVSLAYEGQHLSPWEPSALPPISERNPLSAADDEIVERLAEEYKSQHLKVPRESGDSVLTAEIH